MDARKGEEGELRKPGYSDEGIESVLMRGQGIDADAEGKNDLLMSASRLMIVNRVGVTYPAPRSAALV